MKVTPLDLKKPEFRRALRGYREEEVNSLLASAAESLEELTRQNGELKARAAEMQKRLESYKALEHSLNETLLMAQRAAESAKQNAEREAELIIARAEVQAERIIDEARERRRDLLVQLEHLKHERSTFLVRLRSLLASQWKLLQEETAGEDALAAVEEQAGREQEPPVRRQETARSEPQERGSGEEPPRDQAEPASAGPEPAGQEQAEEPPFEVPGDLSSQLGRILRSGDRPAAGPRDAASAAEENLFWGDQERSDQAEDRPELTWDQEENRDQEGRERL